MRRLKVIKVFVEVFCIQGLFNAVVLNVHKVLNVHHTFSTYAKFSEKLTFPTTRTCAYQEVRNVSFSENFVYALNE